MSAENPPAQKLEKLDTNDLEEIVLQKHAEPAKDEQDVTRITNNRMDAMPTPLPPATITDGNCEVGIFGSPEDILASSKEHIGTIIAGRYRILGLLGIGGMGSVFKAEHIMLGTMVAVKILNRDLAKNSTALKRFAQEAKAASSLKHSNIATVSDYGLTESGFPYFVMDLLDGKSLSELIDDKKFVPWQQAVDFGIQIADAMAYAHQQGIVHRDLKPANIIISPTAKGDERATVVDFGIAKFANETQNAQKLTQTGEVFGSPLYMSPEQCTGKDLDGRSDIYSFGCMMYETLTGEVPFQGPNAVQTILMQINDPPPSLRSTHNHQPPSSIPGGLETVILHCLEKEPASRYSSMDDVKADLQLVKRGMPPTCKSVRRFRFKLKAPGLVQTGLVTAIGTIGIFLGMAFWINKWQYEMVPWQIAYSSGKHEFERSEYSQALMSAQHGIKLATARNAAKHELANLYILLGDIDRAMHKDGDRKLADARNAYEQAVVVATGEKAAQQRVNANQNLGDMNSAGGNFHAALSKYDAALLAFNNHYNDAGHKARLHIRKAMANENLSEYGLATAELEKAADIYRHEDDMKTPALIETLEKLAENEKAHGDASKAQKYFDEAKKLRAAY